MAFEYKDIEEEVAAKLVDKLPNTYAINVIPENNSSYKIPDEGVLIIVAFSDSTFETPTATDIIDQQENVTLVCNVKAINLRGTASINEAIRLLKIALVGFKPANLSKLYLQKIEFDDRDIENNYFSYNVFFTGTKRNTEIAEDLQGPLLARVSFREQIS